MTGTRKKRAYYLRRWLDWGGPTTRKQWAIRNRWKHGPRWDREKVTMELSPMWVWRKKKLDGDLTPPELLPLPSGGAAP